MVFGNCCFTGRMLVKSAKHDSIYTHTKQYVNNIGRIKGSASKFDNFD